MTDNKEIGARLKQARLNAGVPSLYDLDEQLGIPYQTAAAHENGNRAVWRVIHKYARRYRFNIDWLITGKGQPPKSFDHTKPTWQLDLDDAILEAREAGAHDHQISAYFVDALYRDLPDSVQHAAEQDSEAEKILKGLAGKGGEQRGNPSSSGTGGK